jgi:hypothetical protein
VAYQSKRELFDADRVLFAFQKAPQVFAKQIDIWLRKERKSFLGTPIPKGTTMSGANDGKGFRGKLLNKHHLGRPGTWSPQVAGQFKSYIENKGTLHETITMGIVQDNPMTRALELLQKGGSISSDKFMPIPIARNLAQVGVAGNYHKAFQERLPDMTGVRSGDRFFWFYNKNGHKLLLFVGKKQINVKKQFEFTGAWAKRVPAVMRRGQIAMDRATRTTEKLISEGAISAI